MANFFKQIKVCPLTSQIAIDPDLYPGKRSRSNSLENIHAEVERKQVFDARASPEMGEYLDFCLFVMHDASPGCNGLLLRGAPVFEDKAILLLSRYDYNFDLAKFHVLNAE